MKTAVYKSTPSVVRFAYPNAATRREVFQKILDAVLVAASGMGIAAIVLLCLVLR